MPNNTHSRARMPPPHVLLACCASAAPAGRATRLSSPKMDARRPAATVLRPKERARYSGNSLKMHSWAPNE